MRILVVEDEVALSNNICEILRQDRYECEQAFDGQSALDRVYEQHFDLIVLDVMLPTLDGIACIEALRDAQNSIGVLMLSAKDSIEDKVKGLDAGADDYLAKPFSTKELLARVRTLLRRHTNAGAALLQCGTLTLDETNKRVYQEGVNIELTAKEYRLLELFMHNNNAIFTRVQLSEYLWGEEGLERSNNAIDAHMKNLRKKVGAQSIETIRSVGYIMRRA